MTGVSSKAHRKAMVVKRDLDLILGEISLFGIYILLIVSSLEGLSSTNTSIYFKVNIKIIYHEIMFCS